MKNQGYILLEGGAEFGGSMALPDRRAMELAGGSNAPITIIPAAAAPDNNHHRAGSRGVEWFESLGAQRVAYQLLIDKNSAEKTDIVEALSQSRLVYMLGGYPGHLAKSLINSSSWHSMLLVYRSGGVIGGSSAGAMVLAEKFYDPLNDRLEQGLGVLSGVCVIPHFNRSGSRWLKQLRNLLPDTLFVGIDEETGIINDAEGGGWTVYGGGEAVLSGPSLSPTCYGAGMTIPSQLLHPIDI